MGGIKKSAVVLQLIENKVWIMCGLVDIGNGVRPEEKNGRSKVLLHYAQQ